MILNPVVQMKKTTAKPRKQVNFIDYDGTVLHAYTVAEVQTLTALPELPTHNGLICQGWNWTLEEIKALNRAVDVGALYITDDGKTRLYITIAAPGRMDVPLYLNQNAADSVTINWGDGSETETVHATGYVNTEHAYASVGDYVITLEPMEGCTFELGQGVIGATGNNGLVYRNMLRKVELGAGITQVGGSTFSDCHSLRSITMPNQITSIGTSPFANCYSLLSVTIPPGEVRLTTLVTKCTSLSSVSIPNGVSVINGQAFYGCSALSSITIPDGVVTLASGSISDCCSLSSITVPSSVTTVASQAFYNCYGMAEYHFRAQSPPTLETTSSLWGIPADCIIYVPQGSLSAYQTANNWSTYANKMQEEPV